MFHSFRWQMVVFLAGLGLIGIGVFLSGKFDSNPPKVEIIANDPAVNTDTNGKIVAEISGEVAKPGVYSLPRESRIGDLITESGGFTSEADMDYVDKRVNRAARLADGQKIYVPSKDENLAPPDLQDNNTEIFGVDTKLININAASQSELETLWGIGPVTAQNIIEQRPYSSVEELLSKKIIKQNVYDKIKDQIAVW